MIVFFLVFIDLQPKERHRHERMGRVSSFAAGRYDRIARQPKGRRVDGQDLQGGRLFADICHCPLGRCHLERHRPLYDISTETRKDDRVLHSA